MEFRTYLDKDGYLRERTIVKHGPLQPGTLLTKVPTVSDMELRFGVIVAVHSGQVDVLWNPWRETALGKHDKGELRRLMGCSILTREERRQVQKEKYEDRQRRRDAQKADEARDPARAGDPGT